MFKATTKSVETRVIPAGDQIELLKLALKASIDCLGSLAAMNSAASRTVMESTQQIAASLALIKRISKMANIDTPSGKPSVQHSSELQSILLATNEDFSSAVDFNAWKERHNIADLADSFLGAKRHEPIALPGAVDAAELQKDIEAAEQIMLQEGGH